jgi:hypothetical protein
MPRNKRALKTIADQGQFGPNVAPPVPVGHNKYQQIYPLPTSTIKIVQPSKINMQNGVILKIDFEKAYYKIKWPFVRQVLEMKCFSGRWCQWIESII